VVAAAVLSGTPAVTVYPPVAIGSSSVEAASSPPGVFRDVPADHWAAAVLHELAGAGVLEGTGGGLFEPDRPMTRAEVVTALLRARGISTEAQLVVDPAFGGSGFGQGSASFNDVPRSAWYAPAVAVAHRLAIAEGDGDGRFEPDRPVTREELAALAVRAAGWSERARLMSYTQAQSILKARLEDWAQVSEPLRGAVAVALETGLIRGYPDGTGRPQHLTTRAEVAMVLQRLRDAAPPPTASVRVPSKDESVSGTGGPAVRASRRLVLTATAYSPYEPPSGGWTNDYCYVGLPTREGMVAVDPNVIPLGTQLFIQGYGYAIAADVGGGVKGNRIDLFVNLPVVEALRFGMRDLVVLVID